MTQCGISYIFLFRFVVNSATSISQCESPISFPRRIVPRRRKSIDRIGFARAGMASIASKTIQFKRPPRRHLPAKSPTAAKLIVVRSRSTPSPISPPAARHRGTYLDLLMPSFDVSSSIVIDDDQTKVSCVFPFSRDTKILEYTMLFATVLHTH